MFPGRIDQAAYSEVAIVGTLGEGGRSVVHDATWRGRPVALKVYKASALERHARKHALPLPEFEYQRNLAFFSAPGLAAHVAEPLAYVSTPHVSALLQERLDGELYYFWHRRTGGNPEVLRQVGRIVELAHEAGLFDVDLHAMNVLVTAAEGAPTAKLFDFNLIPFHEHPPNPLVAVLLRCGLMSVRERDLRKLRDFHDFRRVERKLLRFYS